VLRHAAYGGVVARGGWAWGPGGENGPTWTLGIVIGTHASALLTVCGLLIGAAIGAAIEGIRDGTGDVLGGG
jgi:hypothetical protein